MKKALGLLLALAMLAALVCVPMAAVADETETPFLLWDAETLDGMQTPVNMSASVATDLEQAQGSGAVKFEFQNSVIAGVYKGYTTFKFFEPVDLSNFTTASIDVYIGGKEITLGGPGLDQCIGINFVGPKNPDDGINHPNMNMQNSDKGEGWRTLTFNLASEVGSNHETKWNDIHGFRLSYMAYGYGEHKEEIDGVWLAFDNFTLSGRKNAQQADPSVSYSKPFDPDHPDQPCVILDCDDEINGWSTSNDVELSLVTDNVTEGEAAVKYFPFNPTNSGNPNNPIGGIAIYRFDNAIDCTNYTYLEADIYIGEPCAKSEGLQITMGTGREDGYNHMLILDNKAPGWYAFKAELTADQVADVDLASIDTMRFMWMNYGFSHEEAGQYFIFDNVRLTGIKDHTKEPPVAAKYPVTGKVLPGETGAAVSGITVALHKVNAQGEVASVSFTSTKTNEEGNYRFAKIQDGNYAVRIKAVEGKYDLAEKQIKVEGEAVSVEDITLNYTPPAIKYGDVTGEGEIDSVDALAVLKHIVGDKIADEYLPAADTYKDGAIDSNDSLCILQYCVGIEKELPVIPAAE